jgi:hypothetical protein
VGQQRQRLRVGRHEAEALERAGGLGGVHALREPVQVAAEHDHVVGITRRELARRGPPSRDEGRCRRDLERAHDVRQRHVGVVTQKLR